MGTERVYMLDEEEKRTFFNLIIDKSGSMAGQQAETIEAVNEYLDSLLANAGDSLNTTYVSITLFDDQLEFLCVNTPLADAPRLSPENYRIGNFTALYDAVGRTIEKVEADPLAAKGRKTYMVLTDGNETPRGCSKKFTYQALSQMILERQGEGSDNTFVFIGAGVDVWEKSSDRAATGFLRSNSRGTSKQRGAIRQSLRAASMVSSAYLADASLRSVSNYAAAMDTADRKLQEETDAAMESIQEMLQGTYAGK